MLGFQRANEPHRLGVGVGCGVVLGNDCRNCSEGVAVRPRVEQNVEGGFHHGAWPTVHVVGIAVERHVLERIEQRRVKARVVGLDGVHAVNADLAAVGARDVLPAKAVGAAAAPPAAIEDPVQLVSGDVDDGTLGLALGGREFQQRAVPDDARRSLARNSGVIRGHSVAGTSTRCQSPPSVHAS